MATIIIRTTSLIAVPILSLVIGCAGPEPRLPPEKAPMPGTNGIADTAPELRPEHIPEAASPMQDILPSGYALTDTTNWETDLEYGQRAILRRAGVAIDTVDLTFGVAAVGQDSLVFLPVRTDTVPMTRTSVLSYESSPTEHVLWTPVSRRELRELLPFFNAYFSSPRITVGSVIHYWGIGHRGDTANRLYAMRYDFQTTRLDSLFLGREDPLATDYRYHLGLPQIHGNEVSFDRVVLDSVTWRVIRQQPASD
jgi:hypothetical protein